MPETPKSVFREIARRQSVPKPTGENPKSVFRLIGHSRRRQEEQEVLALCERAAQEPDPERRYAVYQLTRRYDVDRMAPQVRDLVWRLLQGIVVVVGGLAEPAPVAPANQ
jgi:hypothetical protein